MDKEIWKDIEGYEGRYQVSNLGRVKSLNYRHTDQERILQPIPFSHGYLVVNFLKNKKHKTFLIHRLVAQSFIPNPDNKPQVNHINGVKTDNRVVNLEWVTPLENTQHAIKTNLFMNGGQYNYRAKFTNEQVKKIREEYIPRDKNHNMIALAKKYKVSVQTIQNITANKKYK